MDGQARRRGAFAPRPKCCPRGGDPVEELVKAALQSGFSIAVASYLLVRMESKLEALTLAIRDLQTALNRSGAASS